MKAKENTYFGNLNYTLGNEDSSVEFAILPDNRNNVFAIAGSGSRILPLLAKTPKNLTCIDTSKQQLYFTQLRVESLRFLDYKSFLSFWAYPPNFIAPRERKIIFQKIHLPQPVHTFIENLFEKNGWESLLYVGRWEKTFITLSKLNRLITGDKGQMLFDKKTTKEYFAYLTNHFPHRAWRIGIYLFGSAATFNALLYKGNFPKINLPIKLHKFYLDSFQKLFNLGPVRNNFFLQLLFFGKLKFAEGNPIECNPKVFSLAKDGLKKAKISYIQGDIINEAVKSKVPIDFFSFSDVPSYFSETIEKTYLQKLYPYLSPECILVIRHYLHVSKVLRSKGYVDITSNYASELAQEKMQMYMIKVLRRN